VFAAQSFVVFARFFIEVRFQLLIEQGVHHTYGARRVEHVYSAGAIMRRDFDGGVGPARRGTTDQKRQAKSFSLHLLRDMNHFVQRWRNQTA